MPPTKMVAKVAALETDVAALKTTLKTMQLLAEENHGKLIEMLSKTSGSNSGDDTKSPTTSLGALDKFRDIRTWFRGPVTSQEEEKRRKTQSNFHCLALLQ